MLRPTREDLVAAEGKTIADVIGPGLKVLFCGINPGLYTAATGWHFGRPGNRFWKALHDSGFTPRLLHPSEQNELLEYGIGITNLVARATKGESDLTREELKAGGTRLRAAAEEYGPAWIAFVGIGAYRAAFSRPRVTLGRQQERIADSGIWLLPNTSGLNANHQAADFARLFRDLKEIAFPNER